MFYFVNVFKTLMNMEFSKRYHELNAVFQLGKNIQLPDSKCYLRYFSFSSNNWTDIESASEAIFSDVVSENNSFLYPVFTPYKDYRSRDAILLLHGLNERSWSKYLCWAEYLSLKTGKAVILFPIAFHINRSPLNWSNPRMLQTIYDLRRTRNGVDRSLSFANVALSERISENPYRFYSSGRQSLNDIAKLMLQIKEGRHPLFKTDTHVDVFAYSIGAFLSQITFLANPSNLFSDSRLFMFCGGGIFSEMFGQSRTIMDTKAFDSLYNYYRYEFSPEKESKILQDNALNAFNSMIAPERNEAFRTNFFESMGSRLSGISLQNDKVIPYNGVEQALGENLAHKRIKLTDFEFGYSHENPFPINQTDATALNRSFLDIFSEAAVFLG